jgi:hypothetical protein
LDSGQDVIAALEDAHRQKTICIKMEHVKGHQDKDKAFELLSISDKLFNVFADNLATYALDIQLLTKTEPAPLLPLPRQSVLDARRRDADESGTHAATSLLRGISAEGIPVDEATLDGTTA